jgi:hypothetical protein
LPCDEQGLGLARMMLRRSARVAGSLSRHFANRIMLVDLEARGLGFEPPNIGSA